MNIGIIVPTYNENENIVDLINKIDLNLSPEKVDYNIFIIDDSIESTISKLIEPFQNKVRYFHRGKKLGRGSAVILGMGYVLKTKYTDLIIPKYSDIY